MPVTEREALHRILMQSPAVYTLLTRAQGFGQPYYLGAGCVAQTVWNHLFGHDPLYGIDDADFVYYDVDISYEAEDRTIRAVRAMLGDGPLRLDIKNQARVHVWYPARFGREIAPYRTVEDAITTWPTTATAVGVRLEGDALRVHAPFGLADLFARVVRPNKAQITEEIYRAKVAKWTAKWPELTIIPWEER